MLRSQLQKQPVNLDVVPKVTGQPSAGGNTDFWTWWTGRFGDRFFDMGTLIRAAAGVETGLRDYLCRKRTFSNLDQLRSHLAKDRKWRGAVFQRIQPWHTGDGAKDLLQAELGYDLTTNPHLRNVQELVLHRHLYAHQAGVLDDYYIEDWKKLTGEDLAADPMVEGTYPAQDAYWFRPLDRLADYINAAKGLLTALS